MNKFYNILAVLCLVFSGLGASEKQEKRFLDRPAIDALLGSTKYYGLGCAGIFLVKAHGIWHRHAGFADGVLVLQKEGNMEFFVQEKVHEAAIKSIAKDWNRAAGKLFTRNMMIAPIYFGSVLAYTKYQQSKPQLTDNK
jgi:hypothetical protein